MNYFEKHFISYVIDIKYTNIFALKLTINCSSWVNLNSPITKCKILINIILINKSKKILILAIAEFKWREVCTTISYFIKLRNVSTKLLI